MNEDEYIGGNIVMQVPGDAFPLLLLGPGNLLDIGAHVFLLLLLQGNVPGHMLEAAYPPAGHHRIGGHFHRLDRAVFDIKLLLVGLLEFLAVDEPVPHFPGQGQGLVA